MSARTPMLKQYLEIKKEYPDSILFFRLGDFYEMFFEDARIASKVLGIALTSRNKSENDPVPLCGVPHHSAEPYLAKLLSGGHKVAVCEQVEDPKEAKGVVKRKVVRVLTPGAIIDSEKIPSKENNYLAAVVMGESACALACTDISTGEFRVSSFDSADELVGELSNLNPKELSDGAEVNEAMRGSSDRGKGSPLITYVDRWVW